MLILCDFDGTLTVQDVTNLFWDFYIGPRWREEILPPYREGRIGQLEIMRLGYERLTQSEEELLELARQRSRVREGFERLKGLARSRDWGLEIVSGGLDFYIRPVAGDIPFHCLLGRLDGYWRVDPPHDIDPRTDMKVQVANRLMARRPGQPMVYIGDGRNDVEAAMLASHVFAVKDSTLGKQLKKREKPVTEFESFDEVCARLEEIAARPE